MLIPDRDLVVWLPRVGSGLVSSPDGLTADLSEELCDDLRGGVESRNLTWRRGKRTAASVASIEEAKACQPVPSAANVDAFAHASGDRIQLGPRVVSKSAPLSEVFDMRASQRSLHPPPLGLIGTLLVRTSRVVRWDVSVEDFTSSHRPTPSAGARHPFDIWVAASDVTDLPQGWWIFDPLRCDLVQAAFHRPPDDFLDELMSLTGAPRRPPTAIVLVARFQRTLSRYPAGTSLVWRDAGVLLGYLHLCATDLGLGSCILGTSGLVMDDGKDDLSCDVGCLIVGMAE